ncbi:hypothetical protein ACFQXB_03870 [Plastorhodobacter daqingensis]|uniref:Uncharacterized protein n=1 Tax=Plastorhodobacter daqingensis TaxID=1387281 RepID=A0ABW2UIC2_9RHOB
MKPTFALTLSPDGLSLLHRSPRGWLLVGEAALDDPRLARRLKDLRDMALRIAPDALSCKIVLPQELIRFVSLGVAADDTVGIAAALEGVTPYAADQLAWDSLAEGRGCRVAAVARETLSEAEAFAEDHGFAPLSFVAMPEEDGAFEEEPFFGLSERARSAGLAPETLRHDDAAFVVGRAVIPTDGSQEFSDRTISRGPAPAAEVLPVDAAAGDPAEPEAEPEPAAEHAEVPARGGLSADEKSRIAAAVRAARAEPAATVVADTQDKSAVVAPEVDTAQPGLAPQAPDPAPPVQPAVAAPPEDTPTGDGASTDAPSLPPAEPAPEKAKHPSVAPPAPDAAATDSAAEPAARPPAVGTGRADSASVPPRLGPAGHRVNAPVIDAPDVPAANAAVADGAAAPLRAAGHLTAGAARATLAAVSARARAAVTRPERASDGPAAAPTLAAAGAPASPAPVSETPEQQAARDAASLAAPSAALGRMAVRDPGSNRSRRLLLAGAAAVAVIALAGGLWFLQSRPASVPAAEVAEFQPAPAAIEGPGQPGFQPGAADGPTELAATGDTTGAEAETLPNGNSPPTLSLPTAMPLPDQSLLVTDAPPIAPDALPEPARVTGALGQAVRQHSVALLAASGLRGPQAEDAALAQQSAASETDAPAASSAPTDDLAPTTPDDTLPADEPSAEGEPEVTVTQGRPPVVPPARPRELPSAADEAGAPSELTPSALQMAVETAVADAVADSVPDAAAQDAEDATSATPPPPTAEVLAGFRPRSRPREGDAGMTEDAPPSALPEAADTETVVAEAFSLLPRARPAAIAALAADLEPELDAAATALAVAASPKPLVRPAAIAAAAAPRQAAAAPEPVAAPVAAAPPAVAAVQAPPVSAPAAPPVDARAVDAALAAALAAPVPPEVDDEPEITGPVPNIPTSASVAQQATVTRAINLRQDNLIGIYGSAQNRRALVRTSNGRMLQLRVGDRYDGGQVAAIQERELHYIKNGRTFALAMPQG